MANILEKQGDNVRKAIEYIDERKREQPDTSVLKLISEAGARFNLTPKDEEFLIVFFKSN